MNPLARNTDPATSHVAAANVPAFKTRHHEIIHDAVCVLHRAGAHANQATIAEISGLTVAQVSKRLGEMGKAGLIALEMEGMKVRVVDGMRCWVPA